MHPPPPCERSLEHTSPPVFLCFLGRPAQWHPPPLVVAPGGKGGGGGNAQCTTRRDGMTGPHAHGNVGRQVGWRTTRTTHGGPHAQENAARHVADHLNAEGSGQQKPCNDSRNNQHNPQYANHWAPLKQKRHRQEHRPQPPSARSHPTQHAKGRAGDCGHMGGGGNCASKGAP